MTTQQKNRPSDSFPGLFKSTFLFQTSLLAFEFIEVEKDS